MSNTIKKTTLEIPQRMRSKLHAFQRKIWTVKLIEGCGAALCGLMLSYLVVFVMDRFIDTDWKVRSAILLLGSLGVAVWLPWMCHRWIWKSRRLEQVARLLKVNHPRLGDYLLGVIELVNQRDFHGTSESLCRAALKQADETTADRSFLDAVPWPKHRRWMVCAAVPIAIAACALMIVPNASTNAFARWLLPWKPIDRYTFAQIKPLPERMVVPLAESSTLNVKLNNSQWKPEHGAVLIAGQRVETHLEEPNKRTPEPNFNFLLPPLNTPTDVDVRIGDVREQIKIVPQPRPELSALSADIRLPAYLHRTKNVQQDLRGGSLALLNGSAYSLCATATRDLASATLNGQPLDVEGSVIRTDNALMEQATKMELRWQDEAGLSAKKPLTLQLRSAEDQPPELICRVLEKQRVMMVKDVLTFEVDADDDYGIKTIGMEWTGKPDDTSAETPASGEKIVYAGNPESTDVESLTAAFSPAREDIEPQTIQLRLFAKDYLPNRKRVYSPVYTLFVLSVDDHAIWMTRRLDQWFKQSLETYEQEQLLYKRNLQIRNMDSNELDRPEIRRQITNQAAAEASQARRLGALTKAGEKLVEQAARNEHFGVDHLEKLAGMIQRLKDIESNRMPSVADLLQQAANAEAGTSSSSDNQKSNDSQSVMDSKNMASSSSKKSPDGKSQAQKPASLKTPAVTLFESTMTVETKQKQSAETEPSPPPSPGKLTLPSVSVAALPNDGKPKTAQSCPAGGAMEVATDAQSELLAEFQKVAEELQKLISDLEGSTFVKRFKAMARRELVVARDITRSTLTGFGESQTTLKESTLTRMKLLAKRQKAHGWSLRTIEDDLAAYTTRARDGKFKTVLAEMRRLEAVQQTNQVATRIVSNEPGTSIAHAEMLADTFDRWAEQLVGPG